MTAAEPAGGLAGAYDLKNAEDAAAFYNGWAEGYEAEITENGYVTPQRCAEALAQFAGDKGQPIMDLGCGSGLSGLALKAAGFTTIDGFDIAEAMLAKAAEKGIYRRTDILDLSQPLDPIPEGAYAHAAAIGAISPGHLPVTVLDQILSKLPAGGCLVFSANDHAVADGAINGRINDLVDTCTADLLQREHGPHLPGIGLESWVIVLRKR